MRFHWLRNWVAPSGFQGRKRQASTKGLPPTLERLEDRTVPTVQFLPGPLAAGNVNTPLVSTDSAFTTDNVEPQVVVNRANPTQLIVGSQFSYMNSVNSGASFTDPQETIFYSDGDVATTFDSQGRLFYANILDGTLNPIKSPPPTESGIAITQLDPTTGESLDKGFYVNDITQSDTLSDDKPFLTVDPRTNYLYATWAQFNPDLLGTNQPGWQILVSVSTNQGQDWSMPTVVTPTDPASIQAQGFVWPSTVAVGADGTIYVAYHAQPDYSLDGNPTLDNPNPDQGMGQVWVVTYQLQNQALQQVSRAEAFTAGNADFTFNVQSSSLDHPNGVRQVPGATFWTLGSGQTWILPDPTRPGHVYAVTTSSGDLSSGSYGNVVFATSTDDGQTWSAPTTLVNNNATPQDFSFMPTAAIDSNGDLAVAWYQNYNSTTINSKNTNGDYLLDVYATYSTNGGSTWASPFRITPTSFDPDVATDPNNPDTFNSNLIRFSNTDGGYFPGDGPYTTRIGEYFGLYLLGNTAYVAWNGNSGSDAPSQALYYTTFGINGALTITGDNTQAGQSNNIVISSEAGNPDFIQVTVDGTIEYAGLLSTLTSITVNGAGPGVNDTVTVDFSQGNPIPAGGLSFNGSTGTNTLVLENGSSLFTNEVETPTGPSSGSLVFDGTTTLNFSQVQTVDDTAPISGLATFNGTAGSEAIAIADAGTVNGLQATQINSGTSGTFPVINFASKPSAAVNGVDGADTITVNNPNPAAGLTTLTVLTGPTSGSVINVPATPSGVTTAIAGNTTGSGFGDDTINVGAGGSVQGIQGTLNIENPRAFNTLVLDDSADSIGRAVTLSTFSTGTINANQPDTDTQQDGDPYVNIHGLSAFADINYEVYDTASVSLQGGTGSDTFTLGMLPQPRGNTGLINLDGGGGSNTLVGANQASNWVITGRNTGLLSQGNTTFQNIQNLVGGTQQDVFLFAFSKGVSGQITGTINGNGGGDFLNYSQQPTSVVVNLATGKASDVFGSRPGGISNIQNVIGSANGGDTLTGNSLGNVLVGHKLHNTLTAGSGRSVLIGGLGTGPSGSVLATNRLIGGAGDDLMIGGRTSFDDNVGALTAILAEWQSSQTFAQRVSALSNGTPFTFLVGLFRPIQTEKYIPLVFQSVIVQVTGVLRLKVGSTVYLSSAPSGPRLGFGGGVYQATLTGGSGQNWFFAGLASAVTNKKKGDLITA